MTKICRDTVLLINLDSITYFTKLSHAKFILYKKIYEIYLVTKFKKRKLSAH